MSLTFNKEYFERNASKLFSLRRELSERRLEDQQLDDPATLRRLIRDGIGIRNKINSRICDSLREYLKAHGGVDAYLRQPVFLANVYVAAAIYNLRIQDEIDDLMTFSELSTHEAQLLVSDLLGEEEIADEASAEKYWSLCCSMSYKRAEDAVDKNIRNFPANQADLVKDYLRDYVKTGSPIASRYSAFQLALIQKNSSPASRTPRSSRKRSSLREEAKEPSPEEAHCPLPNGALQQVFVKVERLSQEHRSPRHSDEQRSSNEMINVDGNPVTTRDIGVQTMDEEEEEEEHGLPANPADRLISTPSQRKRRMRVNLLNINRQRYALYLKQMQLEQREIAVAARETAAQMREAAVTFREKITNKPRNPYDPTA